MNTTNNPLIPLIAKHKLKEAVDRLTVVLVNFQDKNFSAAQVGMTVAEGRFLATQVIDDAIADLDGDAIAKFLEKIREENTQLSLKIEE